MKRKMKCVLMIILIVLGGIGICVLGIWCFFVDEEGLYSFATLRSTNGYKVNIRTPVFTEATALLHCKITINGETIFFEPIGRISLLDWGKLKFALIESGEDQKVVALVEQANPHVVIAIYDMKNRISGQTSDAVGEQLLERLEHDTGQSFYWSGEFEVYPEIY